MSAHGNREVEIKLSIPSVEAGRRLLRKAAFHVTRRRVFEANTVFDTHDQRLLHCGTLLRIREVNGAGLLTYKGAAKTGRHKSREELEIDLADPQTAQTILQRLQFEPAFRYEKNRTEYGRSGQPGIVTLDETPIGVFLELEGPPRWIDRTARELGFSPSDYITASYGRLYLEYCRERHTKPGDMIFPRATPHRKRAAVRRR